MPIQPESPANALEAFGIHVPPTAHEIEKYTPERIAEFLLNNAVGAEGYAAAREEVRALGLNPDKIAHQKPPKC